MAEGSNVDTQDGEKCTALHYAASRNRGPILRYLLERGADTEISDANNNTPLHYAAGFGCPDSVAILLDAGANISALNMKGMTPAAMARYAVFFFVFMNTTMYYKCTPRGGVCLWEIERAVGVLQKKHILQRTQLHS